MAFIWISHYHILNFRELYTRVFIADGNFNADHLTPKNKEDDVHLTEGEAFMTADGPYKDHLNDATSKATRNSRVSYYYAETLKPCISGILSWESLTGARMVVGGRPCGWRRAPVGLEMSTRVLVDGHL